MHLFSAINPWYAISGFVVAIIVGMTGVGGGSLMTPILVRLFGIHPLTAVGTDLLFACITKTVGTGVHGMSGTIDWKIVRRLACGSVPATAATLLIMHQFQSKLAGPHSPVVTLLGAALILTALSMLFRKWLLARYAARVGAANPRTIAWLTVVLGAVVGVLVSASSVGAGAIGMTVLLMLYPKSSTARLVGADIAHAVPLTLVAGIGHWFMGSVDWAMLASLLAGSLPGIVIGSLLGSRLPDKIVRPILAGTLALVGAKLAF